MFSNVMITLTNIIMAQQPVRMPIKNRAKKKPKTECRSPASIPSKFDSRNVKVDLFEENTVRCSTASKFDSRNEKVEIFKENTAFGCSTERFFDEKSTKCPVPGPGQYHNEHSYVMDARKCGSVSSRGFTPMISLDPRFGSDIEELKNRLYHPGPGAYNIPDVSTTKPSVHKINFGHHRNPGLKRKVQTSSPGPGPGSYQLKSRPVRSNLGATSFKFTARKESDLLLQQSSQVSVGSYNVGAVYDFLDRLGKEPRKGKDFPDPIFKSQSSRLAPTESTSLAPAPGHYEVFEPHTDRDRMHVQSACFNTGLDRFGTSNNVRISRLSTPAPGSYYPNQISRQDSLGAAASFASTTSRFDDSLDCRNNKTPGPQSYYPVPVPHKSFLQNRYYQWV